MAYRLGEAEGEGGERFYVARSVRRADLQLPSILIGENAILSRFPTHAFYNPLISSILNATTHAFRRNSW